MKYTPTPTSQNNFWIIFFSDYKNLLLLFIVCMVIAIFTSMLNGAGYLPNVVFSLCYGFPIYMTEFFLRTRKNKLSDLKVGVVSVVVGSITGTTAVNIYTLKKGFIESSQLGGELLANFSFGATISVVAFYFFWSRYRNQELTLALREQQLKASELAMLKQQSDNRLLQSQMEPHFLFNTLANIQSLVEVDADLAKLMLANLSSMLRAALKNSEQDYCTIEQELTLVRAYLGIQKIRIGDRLEVVEKIDENVGGIKCIPMLLQPLVENSLRHGVERKVGQARVEMSIYTDNGMLVIEVKDDCSADQSSNVGHGLSLRNIQQRLTNCYSGEATFNCGATSDGWKNELRFPLLEQEVDA